MRRVESGTRVARLWRRFVVVDELSPGEAADWLAERGFAEDAAWLRRRALPRQAPSGSWPPSPSRARRRAWRIRFASQVR